jgi:hypothetical protein
VAWLRNCRVSRTGLVLFAFLFFTLTSWAQSSIPDKCGFAQRSQPQRLEAIKRGEIQATRPMLQKFAESATGRFRVHYDVVGANAVDTTDASGNGLPDYVDECISALEHAWRVEIDTLGYTPPPSDGADGGSPALDVYVQDLGPKGFYGIATPDRRLREVPTPLWLCYLEIDNDYSPTDSASGRPSYTTTGLDALRITCAHEFHHAVQNGCYAMVEQHRMLYELTSTWMEMRCWPEVRDWAYYASALLTRPDQWSFARSPGRNGYVWGWFGNALAALPGNVLRSTWERIGQARPPFAALVEACTAAGTSIDDVFCSAVEAMYRTGSRGSVNPYMPGASLLPELSPASEREIPRDGLEVSGTSVPFTAILTRLRLTAPTGARATGDVLLAFNDGRSLSNDTLRERPLSYRYRLHSEPTAGDVPISATGWGVSLSDATPSTCLVVDGIALIESTSAFPQPLDRSMSRTLYVPVGGATIGSSVTISILNIAMQPVQPASSATISIVERRVVAAVDVNDDIAPGTYFLFVDDRRSQPTMQKIFIK